MTKHQIKRTETIYALHVTLNINHRFFRPSAKLNGLQLFHSVKMLHFIDANGLAIYSGLTNGTVLTAELYHIHRGIRVFLQLESILLYSKEGGGESLRNSCVQERSECVVYI